MFLLYVYIKISIIGFLRLFLLIFRVVNRTFLPNPFGGLIIISTVILKGKNKKFLLVNSSSELGRGSNPFPCIIFQ